MAMNLKRLAKALAEATWRLLCGLLMPKNCKVFIFHAKMNAT